jgi:hypothetical protein
MDQRKKDSYKEKERVNLSYDVINQLLGFARENSGENKR